SHFCNGFAVRYRAMAQAIQRHETRTPELTLEAFGELLAALYCAAATANGWPQVLEALRSCFRARTATLFIRLAAAFDPGLMLTASQALPGGFKAGPSRGAAGSLLVALAPDQVMTNRDLLPDDQWRASDFYHAQCRPFGMFHFMGVNIGVLDGAVYPFWLGRSEQDGPFSEAERLLCKQLLPHLRRALELQLNRERDRAVQGLYGQALADLMVGLVVLDAHGRVLERNVVAESILGLQDGLRLVDERLEAAYAPDRTKLQQLLRKQLCAGPDGPSLAAISIGRPSGKSRWSLLAHPIRPGDWRGGSGQPAIALFLRDVEGRTNPHVDLVQGLFQLTGREALLAIHLANGLSVEEAARALGVRLTTVRAHLRSMYSKIGVRRQAELVRLILNSVALLGRPAGGAPEPAGQRSGASQSGLRSA
ncbi:MAG: LuxR C-terminal-related transcriptional regulator, partial [Steroidobacteraceae bacterium]|nr:LuxR C-terminal-related transcriptional regulator [Steroidobacteraceae bacterium]